MSSTPKITGTKRSAPNAPYSIKTKKARTEIDSNDESSNKKSLEYEDPSQSPRYSPITLEMEIENYNKEISKNKDLRDVFVRYLEDLQAIDITSLDIPHWQLDNIKQSIEYTAKDILSIKNEIYRIKIEKAIAKLRPSLGKDFESDMLQLLRKYKVDTDNPVEPTPKQVQDYIDK